MTQTQPTGETMHYLASEAVGVFADVLSLDKAVVQLGIAGFNRTAISVLGLEADRAAEEHGRPRTAAALADDPNAPLAAPASQASRTQIQGMTVAIPLEVGAFGAAWAAAAAGGALLFAVGITVAGGVVGAGLGALLYHAVSRRHAHSIQSQLAAGGLVLWVGTPNKGAEASAMAVLKRCGGASVHIHQVNRTWSLANSPLYGVQPDPFLEHGPCRASS